MIGVSSTRRSLPGTAYPRLGILAAIVMWGISFVATKAVLREISPIALICGRFALGTGLLVLILALRGHPLIPPPDAWAPLAVMGFFGVFVHQMLQANALTMTSAIHAGWLIGLIPIWSALLAATFLGERFGAVKVLGILVGFSGAVLVTTRGELTSGLLALPTTRGDLLILASTINWAVYTVLGRRTLRRLGPARATTGAMFLGWLMLLPFLLLSHRWQDYVALSGTGWAAVLFLGLGCSGLGYLFWYGGLERLETSQVAAYLYLEPFVTLVAAIVLLDEPFRWPTVLGGILVLAGVFLVQHAGRQRKPGDRDDPRVKRPGNEPGAGKAITGTDP
jgi:drug/metabolite transporter (DMT)-like permease